ncbi:MAG: alkaline phosphatase family protein [Bdellovibrionales bacterium]|jgi:alkaline phosphatase D|nr:alkaline phosphatase family protein [Bdellovibrionales bacterium]MBT3527287.1 alkaline phosphatase family protein [Bdellovibrionales bacterium]MBT7668382.1 alkaline phosphatase family protein [Bdellovibrionales bacterium]MBT7765956.1 alkaline phosphatase family protein [Bdellovibrionales bacterium]
MRINLLLLISLLIGMTSCSTSSKNIENPTLATSTLIERVAFGSCMLDEAPQEFWKPLLAHKPQLMLLGGDNVYFNSKDYQDMKRSYQNLGKNSNFNHALGQLPIHAVWDDNDYGAGDGGGDNPMKEDAKQAFLARFPLPATSPVYSRDGIYRSYSYGPANQRVQIILLDTRFFRSPLNRTKKKDRRPGFERYTPDTKNRDKTMLGAKQWRWLEKKLQQPAKLRLIVTSIQFLATGHGWEKWGNLPYERERMFKLIAKTGAQGVIFLSGDRHIASFYRQKYPQIDYPIYDITSSGLTHISSFGDEAATYRMGKIITTKNFGILSIDWDKKEVKAAIHNAINGQVIRVEKIRF